jgi:hypothetical protein
MLIYHVPLVDLIDLEPAPPAFLVIRRDQRERAKQW